MEEQSEFGHAGELSLRWAPIAQEQAEATEIKVLAKPFSMSQLKDKLSQLVDSSSMKAAPTLSSTQ